MSRPPYLLCLTKINNLAALPTSKISFVDLGISQIPSDQHASVFCRPAIWAWVRLSSGSAVEYPHELGYPLIIIPQNLIRCRLNSLTNSVHKLLHFLSYSQLTPYTEDRHHELARSTAAKAGPALSQQEQS